MSRARLTVSGSLERQSVRCPRDASSLYSLTLWMRRALGGGGTCGGVRGEWDVEDKGRSVAGRGGAGLKGRPVSWGDIYCRPGGHAESRGERSKSLFKIKNILFSLCFLFSCPERKTCRMRATVEQRTRPDPSPHPTLLHSFDSGWHSHQPVQ
ncbi:unnamed protein product [Boreogadus saida]